MIDLKKIPALFFCYTVILFFAACSGGGGDGGGSGKETAVRIIHGAIDGAPVVLKIGQLPIQEAYFGQITQYAPVAFGPTLLTVERANSPGVKLAEFSATLAQDTEYSLFIYGEASRGQQAFVLVTDSVITSPAGRARIRLQHALTGQGKIILKGVDFESPPIDFGSSSDYFETQSEAQTFLVKDNTGRVIAQEAFALPDQGDASFVIMGSKGLGVRMERLYADLD